MEVTQMLATHSLLINTFLGFLVGGFIVPFITAKNPLGFRKASFIYTMTFQAIITMIAFAGIVAVFTGDLGWSITTIIMMGLWAIMMYIEIQKHKAIKVANLQNEETFRVLKSAFLKISALQILLIVVMMGLMLLKAEGTISI
ncbi:hypothetical protein MNB_SV-13-1239 [hydrothermal vent metagenome]|uniref:DUF4149 domain-containing protein n=1 Tax=hydrothermal vent metagenome TaxID=652676 RepID=A0A1W1D210_9ZZZZ